MGRRNRRKRWVRAVMWPGLMLQNLTTREPDREQLAVAIAALESVLAVENPEAAEARESCSAGYAANRRIVARSRIPRRASRPRD